MIGDRDRSDDFQEQQIETKSIIIVLLQCNTDCVSDYHKPHSLSRMFFLLTLSSNRQCMNFVTNVEIHASHFLYPLYKLLRSQHNTRPVGTKEQRRLTERTRGQIKEPVLDECYTAFEACRDIMNRFKDLTTSCFIERFFSPLIEIKFPTEGIFDRRLSIKFLRSFCIMQLFFFSNFS